MYTTLRSPTVRRQDRPASLLALLAMSNLPFRDAHSAQPVSEADKAWSIEQHAIEPIPASDRHGTPIELFRL